MSRDITYEDVGPSDGIATLENPLPEIDSGVHYLENARKYLHKFYCPESTCNYQINKHLWNEIKDDLSKQWVSIDRAFDIATNLAYFYDVN